MNLSAFVLGLVLVAPPPAGRQTPATTTAPSTTTAPATTTAPTPGATTTPQGPVVPGGLSPATYRIGLEDEIRLVVAGEEQLTNVFRVQSDGGITLPLLNSVAAQGLTAIELQERIRAALAKDFFVNPQVRVEVSKYGSQFVIIQGEVRAPQRLAMTGPMRVNEALIAAGSWTPNASSVINVARPRVAVAGVQQDATIFTINLDDLIHGVADANISLQGGDIITVPKAETIFVQGRVKNVGVYNWEPGTTVQQAILKAGGIDDRGRKSGIKITRIVNGKNKEIDVKETDPVQPNDIIVVPQRRF